MTNATLEAQALLDAGRPADAEAMLRMQVMLEPDARAFAVLGHALMALDRPADAERAFLDATMHDPDDADLFVMAGHAARGAGKGRKALRHYEEAVRTNDRHVAARYYLAECLIQEQDVVRASTQLKLVQQLEPDYGPAIALLGDISFLHKDYRQAIVEYARAHGLDALDGPALKRLGDAFELVGDDHQALKAYDLALKEQPNLPEAQLAAAELCERKHWLHRAARYYGALAYVGPYRVAAHHGMTRIEQALGAAGLSLDGDMDDPYAPGPFEVPATLQRERPAEPEADTRGWLS